MATARQVQVDLVAPSGAASEGLDQAKWPPLRRPHLKSRGGCKTCKARRVKCDEQKPACGMCLKANRTCGGYEEVKPRRPPQRSQLTIVEFKKSSKAPPAFERRRSANSTVKHQVREVPRSLSQLNNGVVTKDLRAVQYFRERLLPTIYELFQGELWKEGLFAISEKFYGIRHLVIAISEYHESIDWTSRSHPWRSDGHPVAAPRGQKESMYALKHYTAALTNIRESINNGAPNVIIKIATFLFAMLEFLRGQRFAAMDHFATGVRLVLQRKIGSNAGKRNDSFGMAGNSSPSERMKALTEIPQNLNMLLSEDQTSMDSPERDVNQTIAKLSLVQSLYYRPGGPGTARPVPAHSVDERAVGDDSKWDIRLKGAGPLKTLDMSPGFVFKDINDARDSICQIMANIVRLGAERETNRSLFDTETMALAQKSLEQVLKTWASALNILENNDAQVSSPSSIHALCDFLRVHHLLAQIYLRTSDSKSQVDFDAHFYTFRAIVNALEELLCDPEALAQISTISILDMGVTAPLFYTATKCRDSTVRRRAIKMIKETPRMCRLWWNGYENAKAAELAVEFEEKEALIWQDHTLHMNGEVTPETLRYTIPEEARIQNLEILERDPSDTSKQVVVIKWRPNGLNSQLQTTTRFIDWTLT